jgi:hypothetical protein
LTFSKPSADGAYFVREEKLKVIAGQFSISTRRPVKKPVCGVFIIKKSKILLAKIFQPVKITKCSI